MTKPTRPGEFTKREMVLFILAMIAATALTVEGTYYILKTFVISNPNDPLTKAGGLSSPQVLQVRKGG
jgi:hypothetical protein